MEPKDREKLAEHLANMSYRKARNEIRRLDPEANLRYWRNSMHNEWHTTYVLPSMGVKVTLVEVPERTEIEKTGPLPDAKLLKVKPVYIEARVEPLVTV